MNRLTALTAILLALTTQAVAAPARPGIDFRAELQPIDGFGFSMAFQRADLLHGARGLSPAKQREVCHAWSTNASACAAAFTPIPSPPPPTRPLRGSPESPHPHPPKELF